MKRFDNRTVIVTGGARGMGASHARGFVAEGVNVDEYTNRGWNKDNFTPLIFVDDRLSGWGWSQLNAAAQRYEFVIRPFLAPGR
jgi:hypothetical protein